MPASQVSVLQPSYRHITKSLFAARMFYLTYVNSGTLSEPNWVLRALIKSALVLCV